MSNYCMFRFGIPVEKINVDEFSDRQSALPVLATCSASYPYRTFDGSCNNLNFPRFGQANTIFQRLLGVNYSDGKLPTPFN